MSAMIAVQRTASVVLVTGGAFLGHLLTEQSRPAVLGSVVQLQEVFSASFAHALGSVWPALTTSRPLLAVVPLAFAFFVKKTFFSGGETDESRRVRAVKKRLLLAQMAQALRWNEDSEAEEGEAEREKGTTKKQAPAAKDLFEMVFDDVEERRVTDYGIAADAEPYVGVWALFKERLAADLADAVRFTNLARQEALEADRGRGEHLNGEELKRAAEYRDGTKLQDLLELCRKVRKAFGRGVLDAGLLKEAQDCRRRLVIEQRKGVRMLWPLLRPLLPMYSCAVALMAFDSVVGCVTYNGLSSLLDGVAEGTMTTKELRGVTLQAYLKLVCCIFAHLSSWALVGKVTSQFRLRVRNQIMANMVRQDMKFFDILPSGILQQRLNNDAEQLASKMFHLPNRLVHHLFLSISVSYALHGVSRPLFFTVLVPVPLISGACYFIIKCMHKLGQRQRKIGEHVAANTTEVLKEIRTVREFAMEQEETEKFAANSAYRAEVEEYASALHNIVLCSPLVCLFDGVRFSCTYLGGVYVASGVLTVGQAIQAASLANDLQHIVQGFFHILPEMVTAFQPLGRVCDILSMRPKIEPHPNSPLKLKPESFRGAIEFKDVDFFFPAEPQKPILHRLTFSISPGEKVGFVGATGSGKSTSIKLIERFYEPQGGSITLDGRPISDYDVHHLRRHMSVVAQDNTLFSTTFRENIIYGLPQQRRESITDAEIEQACRKANAWTFVNEFPRKLETYAGERGVKLSGGQKQRLAIARAIIRKPTIILLDEATSALDSKAEVVVKEALDKMIAENASGCTIIIAHRLTTVKTCHKILVMDKGSIKETGSHEELMKIPIEKAQSGAMLRGWYHDLWETQHGKDEPQERSQALLQENKCLKEELACMRALVARIPRCRRAAARLHTRPLAKIRPRQETARAGGHAKPPLPPALKLERARSKEEQPPPLLEFERACTTEEW